MAETSTLKVGDAAPDFELPSHPQGETPAFKLSDHRGETVVINFVPAAFSPVCTDQLPMIAEKFAGTGATTVVISTDNTWSLAAWREQAKVTYPVLSDFNPTAAVTAAYGVRLGELPMANRAVIVVDGDGKVAHIELAPEVVEFPDYGPVLACIRA